MPIPASVRAILGNVWASSAGALRQDPSAADPAIVRADGYPATFSSTLVPEQETIQGRWNEFDSAIDDIYTSGVPFYDALIDYPVNAIVNEAGVLSTALVANGPDTSNAIAPSADTAGTTWSRVSGAQGAPSAPAQPTAVAGNGTLDVSWNCPLDGGSVITGFELQYRVAGGSWPGTSVTRTVPSARLTGLTNGTALEFRVNATNAIGTSPWSATGTGTPTASVPAGGSAFALTARGGDTSVSLTWQQPDDGGDSIDSYDVQWKSGVQDFSSSRQASVTTESYTRTGLNNGTQYTFRVRAVNGAGNSTWSNEATATPAVGEHYVTAAGSTTFSWPWQATKARVFLQGGEGGGGSGNTAGNDGDDSSLTFETTVITANGGDGASGGVFQPDVGQVAFGLLTGLMVGDSLQIVVGAGGTGGIQSGFTQGTTGDPGSVIIVPVY